MLLHLAYYLKMMTANLQKTQVTTKYLKEMNFRLLQQLQSSPEAMQFEEEDQSFIPIQSQELQETCFSQEITE